jgi:16S rRNA (cytosine967-C5)-methyltransferase
LPADTRPAGAAVRAAAAAIVSRVVGERMPAEDALAGPQAASARDASLLAALVYGALRWHHRLAWQCGQLLTRPLKAKHAELGALLRIGLLQLQQLRIPDHAAVSATVDAAAALGFAEAGGLVNAVLRRFLRDRKSLEGRMSSVPEARFSHPQWLIERIRADWPSRWESVLEANNALPPMWLRVNLRQTSRAAYAAALEAAGYNAAPSAQAPAALLLATPVPVESLPGFAAGDVSVQDAAAQLAAGYLNLEAGLRVLDACAAPGGKTGHILEAQSGLAEVVALDRDPVRLSKVQENLGRLRLPATLIAADAADLERWWDGRPFDRVLLDAPCSATGVIRRHPDIKLLRRPDDVVRAAALQNKLLEALWRVLKPGGRLVYATCSVLRAENDEQVLRFVRNTPDAELAAPGAVTASAGHQLLPGEADADGFYYACLDKQEVLRASTSVFLPQQ